MLDCLVSYSQSRAEYLQATAPKGERECVCVCASNPSDSLTFACYLALHCLRGAVTLSTPLKNIAVWVWGPSSTARLLCLLCLVDRLRVSPPSLPAC